MSICICGKSANSRCPLIENDLKTCGKGKIRRDKVFGKVDLNYIDEIIVAKGFGKRWRKLIRGCISTTNFSISPEARFLLLDAFEKVTRFYYGG